MSQFMRPTTDADKHIELVEAELTAFFDNAIRRAATIGPSYVRLWEDMSTLIRAGGKRLRPRMVYLAYYAFGGEDLAAIAPIAAASELLHQSMLIHDDIIDRDLMRYGVGNITARYLEHYRTHISDDKERHHYALSAALLAGDSLLSGSHALIALAKLDPILKSEAQAIFSHSIYELVGGELIDTESTFVSPADIKPLDIARYKTASYSFISPLLIGAVLAGATAAQKQAVRRFAEGLGIAFQLQDDALGVFGDSATTGKSTISDLREGKRTYLIACFDELASSSQKQLFYTTFGTAGLSSRQAAELRDLLERSGARSKLEQEITRREQRALRALSDMNLSPSHQAAFIQLIDISLRRQK